MRKSPMMDFPIEEFEHRMNGLFEQLNDAECDAVLLTNEENLRYFCGYRSAAWNSEFEYPAIMLVTRAGKIGLITSDRRKPTALMTACLDEDDIYSFEGFGEQCSPDVFAPAIAETLKKLGVQSGKLGTETGVASRMRISYNHYEQLFELIPDIEPMDFSIYIFNLREIKSQREIEIMRKCSGMAVDAFKIAIDKIEIGKTTEEEVYHEFTAACFDMGADDMEYQLIVEFGPDRRQPNCMPGDRVYETDDWCIFLDSGPALKGYVSDIIRIGKLSPPTKAQKDFYQISYDCHQKCIAMVKPGVRIGALCEKHDEMMREYGVEDICLTMNNSGHGIGQDIHEMPILKSIFGDKTFKPGMVFAFEPTIIHPVEGQIVLESNYVVTETGCENLTPQLQECIYVPDRK